MPSGALMPVMKTDGVPALPSEFTGIWTIWWNAVLATKSTVPSLLELNAVCAERRRQPRTWAEQRTIAQLVGVPPLGPTFQITPLNEWEM